MEIRSQSQTGPLVPSLAEIPAKLSQQLDAVKQQWLDQLNRDPASFVRLEVEIHDPFRTLRTTQSRDPPPLPSPRRPDAPHPPGQSHDRTGPGRAWKKGGAESADR